MANPWWACYSKDYTAKTGHLTMLQHGAYFTLLNTYYMTGGPLPEKVEHLTRLCGAHLTEEIEAISFVLSSFFSLKSDGWHNKRADAEIRDAKRISNLRRLARLGKRKTIVNQVLPICAPQSQPHTQKEESKAYAHSRIALPALGEVIAYCQERGNKVDPQQWFNYYTANGWKVGRNPMKDWRAAVRTWEKNGYGTNRPITETKREPSAQVARWNNNRAEIERTFGASAGVGGPARQTGDGQAARLSAGDTPLLGGKT